MTDKPSEHALKGAETIVVTDRDRLAEIKARYGYDPSLSDQHDVFWLIAGMERLRGENERLRLRLDVKASKPRRRPIEPMYEDWSPD